MTWWHSDFFFMMDHFFTFLWQSMKTLSSLNWWTTKMHPCKNVNDYRRRPTSFTLLTQFFPRTTHFSTTFEHLEPATPCHLNSIAKRNRSHDTMQGGFGGRVGRFLKLSKNWMKKKKCFQEDLDSETYSRTTLELQKLGKGVWLRRSQNVNFLIALLEPQLFYVDWLNFV